MSGEYYPVKSPNAEHESNIGEAVQLDGIFHQITTIAAAIPEGFFLRPQKVLVEGLGPLHWQRIGDDIALTLTQEEKPGEQGYEIMCQVTKRPDGSFVFDDKEGDMFTISRHGDDIGIYPVFKISRHGDTFTVADDQGVALEKKELQICREFAEAMTEHLPNQFQAA